MNGDGPDVRDLPGILGIDHVGVAVPDLDAGQAPYVALGLRSVGEEIVPDQGVRVRVLDTGVGTIELLAPLAPDTPVGRFLTARGPGLHHLAFRVADVRRALESAIASGLAPIDDAPRSGRAGSRVAFLHPRSAGGVLIELVEPAAGPSRP